jgi:hypothetical protein
LTINVSTVAQRARVERKTVHKHPDLIADIDQYRKQPAPTEPAATGRRMRAPSSLPCDADSPFNDDQIKQLQATTVLRKADARIQQGSVQKQSRRLPQACGVGDRDRPPAKKISRTQRCIGQIRSKQMSISLFSVRRMVAGAVGASALAGAMLFGALPLANAASTTAMAPADASGSAIHAAPVVLGHHHHDHHHGGIHIA